MQNYTMPSYIQIEQVYGICSARCTMCTIQNWEHPSKIMSVDEYSILLEKFLSVKNQKFLTLHGDGEVLFDKNLPEKVALAKQMGYKGVGFATNCTHLDENIAAALLESGLDSIICSVDGVKKETHENIRVGTDFDAITNNILNFIRLRNVSNYRTRVLVRFIRQESNFNEWAEYRTLWNSRLDAEKGDSVLRFDVHNWGGAKNVKSVSESESVSESICTYLFDRIFIHASGKLALCCGDSNQYFDLGNAFETDPLELFNSGKFVEYRTAMREGKIDTLHPCRGCTIIDCYNSRISPKD